MQQDLSSKIGLASSGLKRQNVFSMKKPVSSLGKAPVNSMAKRSGPIKDYGSVLPRRKGFDTCRKSVVKDDGGIRDRLNELRKVKINKSI